MQKTLGLTFLFCILFLVHVDADIGCLNGKGDSVDWWVIMKVPFNDSGADSAVQSGYAYAYLDADSESFEYSGQRLDWANGSLALTLNQMYSAASGKLSRLMYNDEWPSGKSSDDYGHTKGVAVLDADAGFWLVHSVPRFPVSFGETYSFPDEEKLNGQSFLCLSLDVDNLENVFAEFLLTKPYTYDSYVVDPSVTPNLAAVVDKQWDHTPKAEEITLKTVGGNTFHYFAKNAEWNNTLYESEVEPALGIGMRWETWMNGNSGKEPSFCTPEYKYDAINCQLIGITPEIQWPTTKDHSKWGAALPGTTPWSCIGDINRQSTQMKRGGGTVCRSDSTLYKAMNGLIVASDSC